MENESKANELGRLAIKLSQRMDRYACENHDDMGNWLTKKAEREYARMDRQLQKLDAELNTYCHDGE